jgi:uncharacterized hydrophobic protein (TIGR00271 family)
MNNSNIVFRKISILILQWFRNKAAKINHPAVIRDIYTEVDISVGYFLILSLANLIALSGLINNSAPVIIGAMLISPLMGPILSFGFAFITGEEIILKKAVRKIAISLALTIVVAVVATYLSPLKEITNEIISRTKPNLYDLAIAFLSGTAGAVAICTKKNYLTVVPGVAIATAVIPPLSVAGFGLGTGSLNIAFGGFFLFFTNFVAIIIATGAVFYFYGFRPATIAKEDTGQLKKRVALLAGVLFIISIPLIYTLHESISEIAMQKRISGLLKREFDREKLSSLQKFGYIEKAGTLEINAVINTVAYFSDTQIEDIEKDLSASLKSAAKLNLDQIRVQPRGLKEPVSLITPQPKPPREVLKASREDIVRAMRQTINRVERLILPSPITDFQVGLSDRSHDMSIVFTIRRDAPLSGDQLLLLKRLIADELGIPVELAVLYVPFVQPITFNKGETILSDEMKMGLDAVREAYAKDNRLTLLIETFAESSYPYRERVNLAEQRVAEVANVFSAEFGIPASAIKTSVIKDGMVEEPFVKVTIRPEQGI